MLVVFEIQLFEANFVVKRNTYFDQTVLSKVLTELYSVSVLGASFLRAPLWPVARGISLLFPNSRSFPGLPWFCERASVRLWQSWRIICIGTVEMVAFQAPVPLVQSAGVPTPNASCLMS